MSLPSAWHSNWGLCTLSRHSPMMFLTCQSDPESLLSHLLEPPQDDPPSPLRPSFLPVLLGQPPIVRATEHGGEGQPPVTGEAGRLKW